MASRQTFSDVSTPPLPGGGASGLMRQYSERFKTLFDASCLPLTAVGGTANAVTATLDPALDGGGLVDGMKFEITWGAANTAGVTLALNGAAAVPVLNAAGSALVAGDVASGLRSLLEYIGGSFRILSPLANSLVGNTQSYYSQFTASGTWTKPSGLDPNRMITVELWGAGAGGGAGGTAGSGGGGGGAYVRLEMRAADLPSSVSVTIGAGGSVGASGGNTSFGSLATAFGGSSGGGASGTTGGAGGTGAGELEAGSAGGRIGGGAGGAGGVNGGNINGTAGNGAGTIWGGGGGGGGCAASTPSNGGPGGRAVFGGGGGGGRQNGAGAAGTGGLSLRGGNGGNASVAGSAPGGGGGSDAAGARGEVRVWI
jgi:hypothetical protein